MKLISFQQYSLYDTGGGSRILRRLYLNREKQVISIGVKQNNSKTSVGDITEEIITASPVHKKWMRSFIRDIATWCRESLFLNNCLNKIRKKIKGIDADVLHIVDHGKYSLAFLSSFNSNHKIWVSYHDHFLTAGGEYTISEKLWNIADRRLVISNEMGLEYQKLFGPREFEVITDGVAASEVSTVREISDNNIINVYFAGLLHISYLPLFKVFSEALNDLSDQYKFKLTLRGTQDVDFLNNKKFKVEYLPVTMDSELLKKELDEADILYLPIKFTVPEFYKYSLSTKMVGYLGGSGSILYHGPFDSAACNLLKENEAAVSCITLEKDDMIESIKELIINGKEKSVNAKALIEKMFLLNDIQQKFWQL